MARDSSLRASDADREAVAERLHVALRARTYRDLDRVVSDLPATPVKWERPSLALMPAARTALAVASRLALVLVVVSLVLVDAALTVAWWLLWVLLRGYGYAADRISASRRPWLRAHPGRPAGLP